MTDDYVFTVEGLCEMNPQIVTIGQMIATKFKRKLSMNHVSAIRFDKCHHYLLEIIEDIYRYIEGHIETISDETVCC